jgi:hypothetical protein
MQRHIDKKMFFYFTPQYFQSTDRSYLGGIKDVFGDYLAQNGIPFVSLIQFPLKPAYETPDGYHGTVFGNRKVAAALFDDLEKSRFLP